ncbi:SPT2 chromatin protein-domain-containing protein [Fennellomyces sp. T-0311]|nr:SPT2 chromatin protein-domain-containing protein [Fennellomyces sp. T-0311]
MVKASFSPPFVPFFCTHTCCIFSNYFQMMDFEKLMAQATAVANKQDAQLAERARRKRREDDERRIREARAEREREARERERKQQEDRQKQLLKEKKKKAPGDNAAKGKLSATKKKSNGVPIRFEPPAKKRADAGLSFDQLMMKAQKLQQKPGAKKEPSPAVKKEERPVLSGKRPPATQPPNRNIPNIYQKRRPALPKQANPVPQPSSLSARDKIKQMYRQPPQKLNTQKRDLRSISEIQRDIRHSKGIYSDDEQDTRPDPRLLHNKNRVVSKIPSSARPLTAGKRPAADPGARRMPFMRSATDRKRPMMHRAEEPDEDLDDFVVDDEEEEEDYSAEIGRIFRYNKKRYRDEVFSDDDMEADASEVLREEKRSARLARLEDIEEEKREAERQKRLKMKGKSRS